MPLLRVLFVTRSLEKDNPERNFCRKKIGEGGVKLSGVVCFTLKLGKTKRTAGTPKTLFLDDDDDEMKFLKIFTFYVDFVCLLLLRFFLLVHLKTE